MRPKHCRCEYEEEGAAVKTKSEENGKRRNYNTHSAMAISNWISSVKECSAIKRPIIVPKIQAQNNTVHSKKLMKN
jgi:hypothetical protein